MQYFINKKGKNIHRSKNSNITRRVKIVTKKKKKKSEAEGRSFNKFPLLVSFSRYFHFKSFPKSNIFFNIFAGQFSHDNWLK